MVSPIVKKYKFESLIVLHFVIGALCSLVPVFVIPWVLIVILYFGTIKVYTTRNFWGQAHYAAAYMASMEMLVRMSKSGLPHELTKYSVILILLNGVIIRPNISRKSLVFILYFLLLIPSISLLINTSDLEQARQNISFNLSGPLCLMISAVYFYRRKISLIQVTKVFQNLILPIVSTLSWLIIKSPKLQDVEFGFYANFSTSGYGPNQMASVLGLGVLIIGLCFLFRIPLFKSKLFGFFLLAGLAYRGLLTFSRGGMLAPILIIIITMGYFILTNAQFRSQFGKSLLLLITFFLFFVGIYEYTNFKTGNALFNRYAGISYGEQVTFEKYASGRTQILKIDLEIFRDHPFFGIGPGMGNTLRIEYGYSEKVAAHIEFSRMLAEHGIFGVFSLSILLLIPWLELKRRKSFESKFLLIVGVLFCFSFMFHSATRIALPMFMYGLGFIFIISNKTNDSLFREYVVQARRQHLRDRNSWARTS